MPRISSKLSVGACAAARFLDFPSHAGDLHRSGAEFLRGLSWLRPNLRALVGDSGDCLLPLEVREASSAKGLASRHSRHMNGGDFGLLGVGGWCGTADDEVHGLPEGPGNPWLWQEEGEEGRRCGCREVRRGLGPWALS